MRILLGHNSTYYPSQGGGDVSNRLLMEALAARGHDVRVVTRIAEFGEDGHRQFENELARRGVSHFNGRFTLGGVDVHTLTRDRNLRKYFVEQIERFNPEIIILSTDDPAQILLECALEAPRARVIYLVRATIALPFGPDASGLSANRTARLRDADRIVGVSEYVARYVRDFGGMEAVHVPISLMPSGNPPVLGHFQNLYVTTINPCAVKGIAIFLALADRLTDVRFAAVPGWGTTERDLAELRARPNVTLLEHSDNIDDILRITRVLLTPSIWAEARARVVVEAMARGIPVIASNVGGLPEAKMGVPYLLPVNAIQKYLPSLDSRMVPMAQTPAQDIAPWELALKSLLRDRPHFELIAEQSRAAALEHLANLTVLPFEALLKSTERRQRSKIPMRLSPEKQKLLDLRMKQKTWFASCRSRLFCFPYAGAGAMWCRGWNACPALLPGRETRMDEPLIESMEKLVAALEEAVLPLLDGPFVFFGHSMGAAIAFELTHALLLKGRPLPRALIVSAAKPPSLREALPDPTDEELRERLLLLGGTPDEAFDDPDWIKYVYPVVKNDMRLYRTYLPLKRAPLPVPIFAYCGDADLNLEPAGMEQWKQETGAAFRLRVFPGGHFYFQPDAGPLLSSIAEDTATR